MKVVVFDVESNSLVNPTTIWLVVAKDLTKGEVHVFKDVQGAGRRAFLDFWRSVETFVGHNWLEYDYPCIVGLLGADFELPEVADVSVDTLVLSRLADYSRKATDVVGEVPAGVVKLRHSVAAYGEQFGFPKLAFKDFSQYSPEMEEYCVRDVLITEKIFNYHRDYARRYWRALRMEQRFQFRAVNTLHKNGFAFNTKKAEGLLHRVTEELKELDSHVLRAFPPRMVLDREITPRQTKFGTLNRSDFRWVKGGDLSEFNGGPFSKCIWESFNPSSHKQIIRVLSEAGWKPIDKTTSHIEADRARIKDLDKLANLRITGWKINEQNLSTLPSSAPEPARLLAKRIMLESRRRTLTEWLSLVNLSIRVEKKSIKTIGGNKIIADVNGTLSGTTDSLSKTMIDLLKDKKVSVRSVKEDDLWLWITIIPPIKSGVSCVEDVIRVLDGLKQNGLRYTITSERIHGHFLGIGAWTERMAHQQPNTANIPNEFDTQGKKKLLGKELRSLWMAPKNRLLVGVDAEGIQLRIFAHLIDDPEFTEALVKGKKDDKTDPHSLNQRILGGVCKSRAAAKRFIYALLLGAGMWKLSQILECSQPECEEALARLLQRYTGWASLKENDIPRDAKRGYFVGLDGRKVLIPGSTTGEKRHLAMSGYLQNGEAVIMKTATLKWLDWVKDDEDLGDSVLLVNMVHDEWQSESPNNISKCIRLANYQCRALEETGVELGLRCPLAGSYYNDDIKDFTFGNNWSVTH